MREGLGWCIMRAHRGIPMSRTAVLSLLALFLLSSCHDRQKADNQTVMLTSTILANRIGELETKVQDLEDRMDKIDKGGQ